MGKAALPSLAASLLLHLALPLGIGVQVLSVSRAPLLPSKPTELELVPLEPAPPREVSLAALATGSTKLLSVVERPAPARSAAPSAAPLPAAPLPAAPLPAAPLPAPARAAPPSAAPDAVSPSAAPPNESASDESALARDATESVAVAGASSVAEPSVAPTGSALPSSGTATGAALVASGAAAGGAAGPTAGASSGSGGPAGDGGNSARALRAAYLQELRRRVLGHRVYPYLARRARLEGTVCLRVSLDGRGQVARLQATCAAPEPLLEAAFAAVRTAAPFGPLPSPLRELTLDLPMVFQLEAL